MAYKGLFKPKNPGKYKGDPTNIIYRSSWEQKVMQWLDSNKNILKWSSEEYRIDYKSPVDGLNHSYYPDFVVWRKTEKGERVMMIEVKPYKQTQPPKKPKRKTKNYINECMTYGVNLAKWNSAKEYCEMRGWTFRLLTEHELGL